MILYEGPSEIDGAPIVAILTESENRKVGESLQVWIMRADLPPVEAGRRGLDVSVCGGCRQRHNLGGGCYVQIWQAPRAVWDAWKRGRYDSPRRAARLRRELAHGAFLRLGAYGDPAAVPSEVWADLLACSTGGWSGYTHQWRAEHAQDLREIVMASCDTEAEYREARALGWRAFVVRPAELSDAPPPGAVECLSDARGMTCAECTACDGARGNAARTSIWIAAHGARRSRYALPVVQ